MWRPEHDIACYGCETVVRHNLGAGHVPPTWKMVKRDGRYRAFCERCLAAMAAEEAAKAGEGAEVVFVPRPEFRRKR